ncbi:MAG: TetR/AcrR family transcriptional regulator, partial [Caulobacterales bacterium]|nr:TetR/AcrR family transcriptional regulator [Caulobacterales bacterium]
RDALVEAAFAVLSRDPSASLAVIAERAGVGRATLHRYFAGRDDLMRALAQIAIAEMEQAAETACEDAPSWTAALERMLAALIPLGDRHGFLAREPLEEDAALAAEFERQLRETEEMVEAAKREGAFDPAVPTAWIVQAYDHLLYAAWESVRAGDATHAQAAALAWRTLTSGLGAPSHVR